MRWTRSCAAWSDAMSANNETNMLLSIQDLKVAFRMGTVNGQEQLAEAVGRGAQTVSFDVPANSTVALVGESGSGKSVTAMSILNLLPDNARRSGRILWQGQDLLQASTARLRPCAGARSPASSRTR
jgi:peptide/nickel transport system ATP-binding protein